MKCVRSCSGTPKPVVASLFRSRKGEGLIEGLLVVPLRRIPDERGTVFHMLRSSDPHFRGFGEIYFSSVYRDAIKGWHRHADMTLNYRASSDA